MINIQPDDLFMKALNDKFDEFLNNKEWLVWYKLLISSSVGIEHFEERFNGFKKKAETAYKKMFESETGDNISDKEIELVTKRKAWDYTKIGIIRRPKGKGGADTKYTEEHLADYFLATKLNELMNISEMENVINSFNENNLEYAKKIMTLCLLLEPYTKAFVEQIYTDILTDEGYGNYILKDYLKFTDSELEELKKSNNTEIYERFNKQFLAIKQIILHINLLFYSKFQKELAFRILENISLEIKEDDILSKKLNEAIKNMANEESD